MPLSHLLSTRNLDRSTIDHILSLAKEFQPVVEKKGVKDVLKGKILATLFYEPSTRTRLSFETAMHRLGGNVISVVGQEMASLSKGETFADTGRIVSLYADVIAMRHPSEGSVTALSEGSSVPVINAGDGTGEHPTQAILDAYTMQKEKGDLKNLTVTLVGDLRNGRTVHSLIFILALYGAKICLLAPETLEFPGFLLEFAKEKGANLSVVRTLPEAVRKSDVVYMTRVQKERFNDQRIYERLKHTYILRREIVEKENPNIMIMHPLPRVGEITPDCDTLPGAAYFRQAQNGVAVRMAILASLFA